MGPPIPMAATLTHATLLLVMTLRPSGYIMTDPSFGCHMWAWEALARDPGECLQAPQVRLSMIECPQDTGIWGPTSDDDNPDTPHVVMTID